MVGCVLCCSISQPCLSVTWAWQPRHSAAFSLCLYRYLGTLSHGGTPASFTVLPALAAFQAVHVDML